MIFVGIIGRPLVEESKIGDWELFSDCITIIFTVNQTKKCLHLLTQFSVNLMKK